MTTVYNKERSFGIKSLGDVALLAMNTPKPITDELWAEYIELQKQFIVDFGVPLYVLNVTPFHGPNAKHRKMLENNREGLGIDKIRCTAIVSDSMLVRGAVTALGWTLARNTKLRAFSPRELAAAAAWIVSLGAKATAEQMVKDMRALIDSIGMKLE